MRGANSAFCFKRANPLRAVYISGPFAGPSWSSSSWRLFMLDRQSCSDLLGPFIFGASKYLTIVLRDAGRGQRLKLLQCFRKEFQLPPQVFLVVADRAAFSELMPPSACSPISITSSHATSEVSVEIVEDLQSSGLQTSSSLRTLFANCTGVAPNRLKGR